MWYFSWILGLGLALCFGILNAIWYEMLVSQHETRSSVTGSSSVTDRQPPG
jgi:cyd operon protein YbgT